MPTPSRARGFTVEARVRERERLLLEVDAIDDPTVAELTAGLEVARASRR